MSARVLALIVDDSAVVRQVLTALLGAAPGIEVLAACRDPLFAVPVMRQRWPDVIVLDVSMPRMDGLTFLRKIMQERPTPVVVCSSLTTEGAQGSVAALAAGAVAVVAKPSLGVKDFLLDAGAELVAAVRAAARTRVRALSELGAIRAAPATPSHTADVILAPPPSRRHKRPRTPGTEPVVVIGASTGGTQALELVLTRLTPRAPGLVIVQHMPEVFTAAFAARLNSLCEIDVREATSGERVVAGCALIAPGGRHLLLHRVGTQYHVEVLYGPPVNRHRPSVDVLFRSAAHSAGANALGIIMTGMGHDGAAGMLEMRHAGACTLAQDADSCVVYGMPREAVRRGAAERSVALARIADEVLRLSV